MKRQMSIKFIATACARNESFCILPSFYSTHSNVYSSFYLNYTYPTSDNQGFTVVNLFWPAFVIGSLTAALDAGDLLLSQKFSYSFQYRDTGCKLNFINLSLPPYIF